MSEPLRPAFHFTAERDSINDPNGLVFIDGEYHLFFQCEIRGLLHWGHAVSRDLVHWQRLPVALHPDERGHIYSGTAVVDERGTSGLGSRETPALVAFFTYHSVTDGTESQAAAWSVDRGRTWTKHAGNPIVDNPGLTDFRDPKVFWHEASASWVMVLAAGDHVRFYRSENLLAWQYAASWGSGHGAHGGLWECPDLFELPVEGSDRTRWVLSVSVSDGAPAGGSGMQYFVGDFDGWTFDDDNAPESVLWHSWGKDFYAGLTWENIPAHDGRRLMIAWADNWQYRATIPTSSFRGQLTVVRELSLREGPHGPRLVHRPVRELELLRGTPTTSAALRVGAETEPVQTVGDAYEVVVEFEVEGATADDFGLEVQVGDGERTRIGYDRIRQVAYVDRSATGMDPHPGFRGRHEARIGPDEGRVFFRILVDRSLVEVFVNDSEQIVDLLLPTPGGSGFRLFAIGGEVLVVGMTTFPLATIWE